MSYFPCWMWSCSVSVVDIMLLYASPRADAICNNLLWGRERSCLISQLTCNGRRNQAGKYTGAYVHGLMQHRCNSSALALELCLFCIKPPIWHIIVTSPKGQWVISLAECEVAQSAWWAITYYGAGRDPAWYLSRHVIAAGTSLTNTQLHMSMV